MTDQVAVGADVLDVIRRRFPHPPQPQPVNPTLPQALSVLDEFSQHCFADSMGLWPIHPGLVPADVEAIDPDLLFVESAWAGNHGLWRYLIARGSDNHRAVSSVVEQTRAAGVPSVFWNKEDPPHFDDFVGAATRFDVILTTEADMIPRYRERNPQARVETMGFAANAAVHHPRRVAGHREGGVAFAGQYFRERYPERRRQMGFLFPAAAEHDFAIFSRKLGSDSKYQFPPPFDSHVVGSLPYREMVSEYKRHKIFLNVNSVAASTTMCARRIFELASSKTTVVTADSPAIAAVFADDEVWRVSTQAEAHEVMSSLLSDDALREASAHRAWRRVAREHLYLHRTERILDLVGLGHGPRPVLLQLVTGNVPSESATRLAEALLRQSVLADGSVTVAWDEPSSLPSEWRVKLSDRGVEWGEQPSCTHVAAWHPGAQYGPFMLEDLLLHSLHYVAEPVVTAWPWGDVARDTSLEDSTVGEVSALAWLSRSDAEDLKRLRAAVVRGSTARVGVSEAYAASHIGVAQMGAAAPKGWAE